MEGRGLVKVLVLFWVVFCLSSSYRRLMVGFCALEKNFAERYIIKCNVWPGLPPPQHMTLATPCVVYSPRVRMTD